MSGTRSTSSEAVATPRTRCPGFIDMQASPEFQELRSRLRRFVFPMTAFFLVWYATYVLLGAFAHDFMATKVFGNINVGLLLGLRPVRDDLPHHRPLRAVRQPRTRPARRGHPRRAGRRHPMTTLLAADSTVGNPIANIAIFAAFVVITMFVVIRASRNNKSAAEFFTGGRAFSGPQNGIAIAGDYLRRQASSASPARSRSTATTASSTPSASWWPGWSLCCWWPNCCATPANSRWPTC